MVLQALGNIGDTSALPVLLAREPCCDSVCAIAAIGGDQAFETMKTWLADEQRQEWAVQVLDELNDPRAINLLIQLLKEKGVAQLSAHALLGNPHANAWKLALPIAAAGSSLDRLRVENLFKYAAIERIGSKQAEERWKAFSNIPASGKLDDKLLDPLGWGKILAGTWAEVEYENNIHIITKKGDWYLYCDSELMDERTWQIESDGTPLFWNGCENAVITRQGELIVIEEFNGKEKSTLKKISESTKTPPQIPSKK